jgi:NADPH2:quinone reductase
VIAAVVREGRIGLERDAPEPRGDGVLVEIEAACLAPADLQIAAGTFFARPAEPYVPGLDGAGRTADGRRVGIRGAGVGLTRDGCCAERVLVPAEALHNLPEEVEAVTAATFFVPCATAHAALHEVGRLRPGEVVAVRGAGGSVGQVAVQMARHAGAAQVIEIGRSTTPGPADEIDLLVDTVGAGLADWIPTMRRGGRIALVGYAGGTRLELDALALLVQDVALLPVNGITHEPDTTPLAPRWLEALARGDLVVPVSPFPIDRLSEAVAAVTASPSPGRVAVRLR